MNQILKTPDEWLKEKRFQRYEVVEPGGWWTSGKMYHEPVSEYEFAVRLSLSHVIIHEFVR